MNSHHDVLERLIRDHYAPIYRFLRNMARKVEDAEDLAQQTFIRALGSWDRFDGRTPVRAWLYAIAYREFCKIRRRRLWLPLHSDRPAPQNEFGRVEDSELLLDAISRLSQSARAAFLLHHVEELSILEISNLMNIPEGTVKSRLFAARNQLKTLIQEADTYVPEPI